MKIKDRLMLLQGVFGFWLTLITTLLPLILTFFLTQEIFFRMIAYVFSGNLFAEPWGIWMARTALDQTGIFKMYFWFTFFSVLYFPWMSMVRFLARRTSRSVYWAFLASSLIEVIFLLSLLTIGTRWLQLYIENMGMTSNRQGGVIFACASYSLILAFLIWAYKPLKSQKKQ
jgi:hypothetical protein